MCTALHNITWRQSPTISRLNIKVLIQHKIACCKITTASRLQYFNSENQYTWNVCIYIESEPMYQKTKAKNNTNTAVHPLQWRHDERDGVSNHQPHDCLLSRLFLAGEFPAQMASNAEKVSIWWRHYELLQWHWKVCKNRGLAVSIQGRRFSSTGMPIAKVVR